jgi:hypothetical protein
VAGVATPGRAPARCGRAFELIRMARPGRPSGCPIHLAQPPVDPEHLGMPDADLPLLRRATRRGGRRGDARGPGRASGRATRCCCTAAATTPRARTRRGRPGTGSPRCCAEGRAALRGPRLSGLSATGWRPTRPDAAAGRGGECLIAASCSKNFGIYRERTGLLMAVSATRRTPARAGEPRLSQPPELLVPARPRGAGGVDDPGRRRPARRLGGGAGGDRGRDAAPARAASRRSCGGSPTRTASTS